MIGPRFARASIPVPSGTRSSSTMIVIRMATTPSLNASNLPLLMSARIIEIRIGVQRHGVNDFAKHPMGQSLKYARFQFGTAPSAIPWGMVPNSTRTLRRPRRGFPLISVAEDGAGSVFETPSRASPKYDNGNSVCAFIMQLVVFGGGVT